MNLKKLIVPVLCVLLGCAGGAAMGTVTAQTWPEPTNVQRWQQECVVSPGVQPRQSEDERFARTNEELRRRGDAGWEAFHISAGVSAVCFKRPAP